jgi:DNA-binding CsgD family transcriptional regulator
VLSQSVEQRPRRQLTLRQEEVLDMVVAGLGNKSIATRLGISEQVAKEHVSALLRRFNAPNRTALAQVGVEVRLFGGTAGQLGWLNYLFRDAPIGIGVVRGPSHTYVAVNAAYRRIIAGRDVVGKSMADAFPEAPQGAFIAQLDEVRAAGQARFLFDYKNRWDRRGRGPEVGWVSQWLQPMRDESGAVAGVLIYVTDTTEELLKRTNPSGTPSAEAGTVRSIDPAADRHGSRRPRKHSGSPSTDGIDEPETAGHLEP